MQFIDENGEIHEIEGLIDEIQALLNRIDCGDQSVLSREIMMALDPLTLLSIRNNLIQKSGKEVEQNQEWLFGLVDS